jgi:uncharacterized MnhB-related membrane protein
MTAEELVPLVIFATVAFLLVTGLIVAYFLFSHTRRNAVRRRASWIAAVSSGIVALFATLHFAIPALEDFRNPDVSFREALLGTSVVWAICICAWAVVAKCVTRALRKESVPSDAVSTY